VGVGDPGGLPAWIQDLRSRQIVSDLERTWCQLYACSHVVGGVHGSNMVLPSAHAMAVVELMPPDRWGNVLQDILFKPQDIRLVSMLIRILPLSASAEDVTTMICSLPIGVIFYQDGFSRAGTNHEKLYGSSSPLRLMEKIRTIQKYMRV
jgi:hypothetical protein